MKTEYIIGGVVAAAVVGYLLLKPAAAAPGPAPAAGTPNPNAIATDIATNGSAAKDASGQWFIPILITFSDKTTMAINIPSSAATAANEIANPGATSAAMKQLMVAGTQTTRAQVVSRLAAAGLKVSPS